MPNANFSHFTGYFELSELERNGCLFTNFKPNFLLGAGVWGEATEVLCYGYGHSM